MGENLVSRVALPGNHFIFHMGQAGSRPPGTLHPPEGFSNRYGERSPPMTPLQGLQWNTRLGQWSPVNRQQTLGGDRKHKNN